jgi:hypothetical protein
MVPRFRNLTEPAGRLTVHLQTENMLDMMNLTSGLTTSGYGRVSSGQASSCHSDQRIGGP